MSTEIKQGSDEWMQLRIGLCTASRFSDVLTKIKSGGEAAGRRNYKMQLVVERLTGIHQDGYKNAAMEWGNQQEPFARIAFEAKTGLLVQEVDFIRHETIEAGCSPDGLIGDDGGVEIKCPYQTAVHIETIINGMPPEHLPQIQGAMWLSGRKWWDFVSYDPRLPENLQLYIQRVERNIEYIFNLGYEVSKFLTDVENTLIDLKKKIEPPHTEELLKRVDEQVSRAKCD